MKYKLNLQLFAEGDIDEENANLNNADGDIQEPNTNVDEGGDQPPVLDDDTQNQQSIDKDNPANHAFAEMRRKMKEQETAIQNMTKKQKEIDDYYANLAKSKGREDIKTADDYFKAVRAEELSAQYQETQDPLALVALIKESIMADLKPQITQESTNDIDTLLNKEVEDFNKEFKGTLKSIDDITTLPNSDKIIDYMQNNNLPLVEAYKLANPDKIAAANKQAAINQLKGHDHINANSNAGNIDQNIVTASEIADWKRFFPEKTDEQCRKEIVSNKKLFED